MKYTIITLIFALSCYNSCNAQELILSDIIQQAREQMQLQIAKEKPDFTLSKKETTPNNISKEASNTQNAVEKINTNEISHNN